MSNDYNTYIRLTAMHTAIEQPSLTQQATEFSAKTRGPNRTDPHEALDSKVIGRFQKSTVNTALSNYFIRHIFAK